MLGHEWEGGNAPRGLASFALDPRSAREHSQSDRGKQKGEADRAHLKDQLHTVHKVRPTWLTMAWTLSSVCSYSTGGWTHDDGVPVTSTLVGVASPLETDEGAIPVALGS